MTRDELLELVGNEFDNAVNEQALIDAADSWCFNATARNFLYGKTDNPLEIEITACSKMTDEFYESTKSSLEAEYMELIEDEPETYRERALKLADSLENLASKIRDAVK